MARPAPDAVHPHALAPVQDALAAEPRVAAQHGAHAALAACHRTDLAWHAHAGVDAQGRQCRQFGSQPQENRPPVARRMLPVQAGTRIPGAVRAVLQPHPTARRETSIGVEELQSKAAFPPGGASACPVTTPFDRPRLPNT